MKSNGVSHGCPACGYKPTRRRLNAETAEETEFMMSQGMTMPEVAAQLGIKPDSLRRALQRHRKAEEAA